MGTKNKILLAVLASALLGAGCSKSSSSSDSSTAASKLTRVIPRKKEVLKNTPI